MGRQRSHLAATVSERVNDRSSAPPRSRDRRTRASTGGCRRDFSTTSGTLFASHKLPLRTYLAAIAIFCNEVKGEAALALPRDLGVPYKAAFVLGHELREAMAEETKGRVIGGEGETAEVDGACFGGYVKPENREIDRKDRRRAVNQSGKRKSVIIVRERNGHSVPAVFASESAALGWIKPRLASGTVVHADEAPGWTKPPAGMPCTPI